jgi:hypothetical protein
MSKASRVLLLGALLGAGCHDAPPDGGSPDLASAPADLALAPSDDLASVDDLASAPGPDLQPPPETIAICPDDQQLDNGTNTVVRVHATTLIAHKSITPTSLVVQLGGTLIAGSVSVVGQDVTFTPAAPLPANATLQASLGAEVRDTLGRTLAPGGRTWSFSTGAAAQPTQGYKFTPPICPYLGDGAVEHAIAHDGSRAIIAWTAGSIVVATSLNADATDFINPLIVSHVDLSYAGPSVAAADGVATVAYEMNTNGAAVYWSRAQDDWQTPANESLLTNALASAPSVAAASGGHLAIAWASGDPLSTTTVQVIASSDGGATFSAPKSFDAVSDCPQVLYQNGRLVVSWLASVHGPIRAASSTDNGAHFTTPVTVASASVELWCPQMVDGGNGDVLFVYDQGTNAGEQSVMLGRFTPSNGAVATPRELYAPDGKTHCVQLAASPSGKLALTHSTQASGEDTWDTELRTSDDFGQTFGAGMTPDVVDALGACPAMTLTDDDQLTMAWRRDYSQLQVSVGHPRRPCE